MDGMNNNFENNNTTTNEAYQSMPNTTTNYVAPQEPEKKTNGLAIAGMTLGIISIPISCCACAGWICAILGLIFSIIGQNKGKSGIGLAGIICSSIGLVCSLISSITGVLMNGSDISSLYDMF